MQTHHMDNIEEEEDFKTLKLEDICVTDDSDADPDFDLVEEARSRMSKLALKKTRPPRKVKEIDSESEEGEEVFGVEIPELNEKDGKCFEKVEEIIKDGHAEKLKVDQCKVYLRKYGLRLTGNKSILIERIKEHLGIINGGGEKKYPICSFVLNCKGDACTGDVVMFEQKVYEMYNVASRSATGPPCGTRIVAGRIVKESYGAAKQQHTFTIEVLWSKGEKPLPPLHPLLIKGRNLYRLKTMRQKWTDEEERRKALEEKHSRGFMARSSRETRIKVKEMRKMGAMHRTESKIGQHPSIPKQTQAVQQKRQQQFQHHDVEKGIVLQQDNSYKCPLNPVPTEVVQLQQKNIQQQQRQPLSFQDLVQLQQKIIQQHEQLLQPFQNRNIPKRQEHLYTSKQLHTTVPFQKPRQCDNKVIIQNDHGIRSPQYTSKLLHTTVPFQKPHQCDNKVKIQNDHGVQSPQRDHGIRSPRRNHGFRSPQHYHRVQSPQRKEQPRQWCRYYLEGKCYYGENCKYLHE